MKKLSIIMIMKKTIKQKKMAIDAFLSRIIKIKSTRVKTAPVTEDEIIMFDTNS